MEASSDVDDATVVEVTGFQWQWTFRYENGAEATGTRDEPAVLALPVNEPVRLVLYSLDVNHAFYVPDFLIKRDVIDFGDARPPNELTFTITEAGTYAGQCAEFCGTDHADMLFVVEAMPRDEYDAYIEALKAGEPPPGGGDTSDCGTTIELSAQDIAVQHRCHRGPCRRGLLHRVHEQRLGPA